MNGLQQCIKNKIEKSCQTSIIELLCILFKPIWESWNIALYNVQWCVYCHLLSTVNMTHSTKTFTNVTDNINMSNKLHLTFQHLIKCTIQSLWQWGSEGISYYTEKGNVFWLLISTRKSHHTSLKSQVSISYYNLLRSKNHLPPTMNTIYWHK